MFMKPVLDGRKGLILKTELKTIEMPPYAEFGIKLMFEVIKNDVNVMYSTTFRTPT